MPYMLKVGFYLSLILVVVFMWRRKKDKPTSLKLKAFKETKTGLPGLRKVSAEVVDEVHDEDKNEVDLSKQNMFEYKGQKYLPHELLQVPRGVGEKQLKEAFSRKVQSEPERKDLFFKAYQCLSKSI